jgi:predicted anti-sigma-YlaC factor YlaD
MPPSTRPTTQAGVAQKLTRFVGGAALGATALTLLIDSVRFVTYPILALLVVVAGLCALSDAGRVLIQRAAVALGCVTAIVVFTPVVDWAVDAFDVSQPPPKNADAIVMLGAGFHCGTGQAEVQSTLINSLIGSDGPELVVLPAMRTPKASDDASG